MKDEIAALKRARIVDAGCRLFYTRGYAGATLDMVAEQLEVTKPFIYTYFRNKAEVLYAVCTAGIVDCLAAFPEVEEMHGNVTQGLGEVIEKVARLQIDRQANLVVYQREVKRLDPDAASRILALFHEFDRRIAQIVEAGCASGEFHVADPRLAAVWIGGLLSWLARWYEPDKRLALDEVVSDLRISCLRLVGADGY
jgi:AcrR family transcriptional regulator